MTFRRALDDYKRERHAPNAFPGERRTHAGLFSGSEERLVHVGPAGSLRDYSYPLSGLHGVSFSRFGVRTREGDAWFEDRPTAAQTYHGDTVLVETVHEFEAFEVRQRDLTSGRFHLTSFELRGEWPESLELLGYVEFSPDGEEGRSGHLVHDGEAVEVYHNREHDYLTVSTELAEVEPTSPERFEETLSAEPRPSPTLDDDRDGSRLTNGVSFRAPLEDGRVGVVSLLSDVEARSRADGLAAVADRRRTCQTPAAMLAAARESAPCSDPPNDLVGTDLRVLALLSAPTGARMAGPEFDPYHQYSGGYGYTWFRDDAEIARFLLQADERLDLDLGETHRKTARFYLRTQLDDGRWPHRVWPMNGRIAPGWANGHIEGGGRETEHQADQTASALVFLSEYLSGYGRSMDAELRRGIERALATGLDGLDASMGGDGLPAVGQNAWENMTGRFTHAAATFLCAYSAIADAPCASAVQTRAAERARELHDRLDAMWVPDDEVYAVRLVDGDPDARVDSTTFSLVDAHLAYASVAGTDDERLRRLESHLEATFARLWRETEAVRGLKRFEGDTWRRGNQEGEKVWTVSTGWGAYAAERSRHLFGSRGRGGALADWADRLFDEIAPGGSLCLPSGYLPEQFFDSGAPDSATPLGWSHAIRLATYAARSARDG